MEELQTDYTCYRQLFTAKTITFKGMGEGSFYVMDACLSELSHRRKFVQQ